MKIGIQTIGSRGDIVPWIALGQGLQKAGHQVVVYYSDVLGDERFTHYSSEGLSVRSTKEFRTNFGAFGTKKTKKIFQMAPDELTVYMMDEIVAPYEEEMEKAAEHLCQECELIIIGPILYQANTLAQKCHIPVIVLLVDYQFVPKEGNELFDYGMHKLFADRVNSFRKKHALPPVQNVRAEICNSNKLNLLIFSQVFKNGKVGLPPAFKISGFLKTDIISGYILPAGLKKFLDDGSSPVFFSMGSLTHFEDGRFEILDVFLEAIRMSGCRAVVQAQWDKIARDRPCEPSIYTVGFIPHEAIFPQCLAVVHHGGAGTTHTALQAGCPSIVIAYAWDQFDWGRKLTHIGAAPGLLKRKYVDALQLAGEIKKVMVDPEYKSKAEAARRMMKRENGVKKAVRFIEEMMAEEG